MPYITREDGEHFVIPSYRDVISAKQKATAKKEILLLSKSYGEHITLQKKGSVKYELAFSPETGYLLGETVWHHFKRPVDMVFCEAIPDTTEVILVVVKDSSVYLDGSFPSESVAEELVVFLTQENNFEIYVHGDVPIAEVPDDGKFGFEASSVKSFSVLEEPVFPKLPLLGIYKLQPVEAVLKANGIGVAPVKELGIIAGIIVAVGGMWMYLTAPEPPPPMVVKKGDEFKKFKKALSTPSPEDIVITVVDTFNQFLLAPGWNTNKIEYEKGTLKSRMLSYGGEIESLMQWGKKNNINVVIDGQGISLVKKVKLANRPQPKNIFPIDQIIAKTIDDMHIVFKGDVVKVGNARKYRKYKSVAMSITAGPTTQPLVKLSAKQLSRKPLRVVNMTYSEINGVVTEKINLEALGR